MRKALSFVVSAFIFIALTIITQIGGIVYLLAKAVTATFPFFKTKPKLWTACVFLAIYLSATFLIVPKLAPVFGRKPLPISRDGNLIPLNRLTVLLNRHYVSSRLSKEIHTVANRFSKKHPDLSVTYLEANFPFWDGFPLLPHLSHNDGNKLDLAFIYKDINSGKLLSGESPAWLGYGIYEEPQKGEFHQARACAKKGFFQYDLLGRFTFSAERKMEMDQDKTENLIRELLNSKAIKKIFIEPHLKSRLGLGQEKKVRFHGCHAVRHDDHIHLQL
ncbi:hypothetical protein FUAX_12220 [Fulvitalea axinellae]|uniref:Uncharacterized protein n=1 Tax=Fulvitalea axinellae TaxID=1182444 RepID=A0AAU9D937_9BACT|nr:hypothetical protein FUAX_12220 [Fulvitalea axinellae]